MVISLWVNPRMKTSVQLRSEREKSGLTQVQAARRLGVSQPYLSLLEAGKRPVSARVARAASRAYGLPPTVLPLPSEPGTHRTDLAKELAAVGYPGYRHLRRARQVNPSLLLLLALSKDELDARVAEALPWVVASYPDLRWEWLVPRAKVHNLQNRLGFVVGLARELAESSPRWAAAAPELRKVEGDLEPAKLAAETTLGRQNMTEAEKAWLRQHGSVQAKNWNVLSTLNASQLPYAS